MVRARSAHVPGMLFARRASDSTSVPPSRAFFAESRICASALSIRNAGGTSPAPRAAAMRPQLAIELLRVRLQPCQVRLGVRRVLDSMIAVEESGNVQVGADVLDDDVRRVAPASDRDVAIRERESLERRRVRAAHHLEAGAGGVRQTRRCRRRLTRARSARSCAAIRCWPSADRSASCDAKRRSRTGVDAQRRRALRRETQQVVGDSYRAARSAPASSATGTAGAGGASGAHAETSGKAAVVASAAIAWRRLMSGCDTVRRFYQPTQGRGSWSSPNSFPTGSANAAKEPIPCPISVRGVRTRPPAASIAFNASAMSSTMM